MLFSYVFVISVALQASGQENVERLRQKLLELKALILPYLQLLWHAGAFSRVSLRDVHHLHMWICISAV